ncbi:MAG: prolyl aminopeptidase [Alphaproteobacteria bacterium]|nr:prolyl aminopeptidase [Alphaproteobacteria bacterium]
MPDTSPSRDLYPAIEPHETGTLPVGDGHTLYYEVSGNPKGKPALFLHGGPGSGTQPLQRRFFDPKRYRIVLFDQRGAGQSTPPGSLEANTTQHLVADIEALRRHLGIARWVVLGGSWGSTLALAYAGAHPEACTALVVRGIWLGRKRDIDWWIYGLNRIYPDYWEEFAGHLHPWERDDIVEGYARRLLDPDPKVHMPAAIAWRAFDQRVSTLLPQPSDPAPPGPRTLAVSRIENHYVRNLAFLGEGELLRGVGRFRQVPGVIIHGRYDMIAPIDGAFALARAWPEAELVLVEGESHSTSDPGIRQAMLEAADRFADLA